MTVDTQTPAPPAGTAGARTADPQIAVVEKIAQRPLTCRMPTGSTALTRNRFSTQH